MNFLFIMDSTFESETVISTLIELAEEHINEKFSIKIAYVIKKVRFQAIMEMLLYGIR